MHERRILTPAWTPNMKIIQNSDVGKLSCEHTYIFLMYAYMCNFVFTYMESFKVKE